VGDKLIAIHRALQNNIKEKTRKETKKTDLAGTQALKIPG
jgi:hypothetical protein